jgi:hypothetical protein
LLLSAGGRSWSVLFAGIRLIRGFVWNGRGLPLLQRMDTRLERHLVAWPKTSNASTSWEPTSTRSTASFSE